MDEGDDQDRDRGVLAWAGDAPVLGSTTTSWVHPDGPIAVAGDRPNPTLPIGTDLLPMIEHIVVLVMENHSFDNYYGMLGRGDGFTLDEDGAPLDATPGSDGRPVRAWPFPDTTQPAEQPCPDWDASHRSWAGGTNEGFAASRSGAVAMGYWTGEHLPYYWSLAARFPLCDRYFCSVLGPTFPNRRFLVAGTARGFVATSLPALDERPPNGTVFDQLNAAGVSWKDYFGDLPEPALFPPVWFENLDKGGTYADFVADCAAGRLPSVSIVTPRTDLSEENPQDIAEGEAFSARVIEAVLTSPCWPRTVLVFTYDEHGGFYDHVPPPAAVPPDDLGPLLDPDLDATEPGGYDRLGFRVPTMVLSPFARPDHVSSIIHDHTSVLRLIQTKWNLPALTARDANASNLLDCLDLSPDGLAAPAFLTPPERATPGLFRRDGAVDRLPAHIREALGLVG